ncbi:unnamed protein product [Discosporangium mesarthrocarpum]
MVIKSIFLALLALVPAAVGFVVPSATSFTGRPVGIHAQAPKATTPIMAMERSYIMIKPDGVQRGLVGTIISRFEQRGYKLVGLKLKQADEELLMQHYKDLVEKPFFPKLMTYMISGPVVCMAWEGKDVVSMGRKMLGATDPTKSEPGTIRGDFSLEVGRNICHGSDSVESAEREIALWFDEADLMDHTLAMHGWIYE